MSLLLIFSAQAVACSATLGLKLTRQPAHSWRGKEKPPQTCISAQARGLPLASSQPVRAASNFAAVCPQVLATASAPAVARPSAVGARSPSSVLSSLGGGGGSVATALVST